MFVIMLNMEINEEMPIILTGQKLHLSMCSHDHQGGGKHGGLHADLLHMIHTAPAHISLARSNHSSTSNLKEG